MDKLDRSRPFAEVFGAADHRYEQDGQKFGPDEIRIRPPGKVGLVPGRERRPIREESLRHDPKVLAKRESPEDSSEGEQDFGGDTEIPVEPAPMPPAPPDHPPLERLTFDRLIDVYREYGGTDSIPKSANRKVVIEMIEELQTRPAV